MRSSAFLALALAACAARGDDAPLPERTKLAPAIVENADRVGVDGTGVVGVVTVPALSFTQFTFPA